MDRRSRLGLVTFLTLVRFPLVLLFFASALLHLRWPEPWIFATALVFLVISAATDLVDGYLARRLQVETCFGEHADPLMDKLFYLTSLPLLVFVATYNGDVAHGAFLLVLTVLFLIRDQWVTFLRAIGSIYHISGSADWSGKLRTAVNFPLICTIYIFLQSGWGELEDHFWVLHVFEALAIAINLFSFYTYTRRYWPYLRRAAHVHRHETGGHEEP